MNLILSVFIPVYNGESYIEECIRAVVSQTFQDWELIVVNNASKDQTGIILGRLLAELNDSRIKVVTNKITVPAPENWNIGLKNSSGEYLKMICADDVPMQDCFERQIAALQKYPQISVASGSRIIINSKGKKLFKRNGIYKEGIHSGRKIVRRCIMAGTNIIGDPVNVMWRRSATEAVGYFDTTVVYCTDIEYWLRLLSVGDLYYDTEPVAFYRIHSGAAATGMAVVTVKDFLHTSRLQQKLGTVTLSENDLRIVAIKSHLQSKIRQYLYRILG